MRLKKAAAVVGTLSLWALGFAGGIAMAESAHHRSTPTALTTVHAARGNAFMVGGVNTTPSNSTTSSGDEGDGSSSPSADGGDDNSEDQDPSLSTIPSGADDEGVTDDQSESDDQGDNQTENGSFHSSDDNGTESSQDQSNSGSDD